ncbi:MAG TPA: tetratricopeptide repeat protein, partial [Blastocatellia bacterium]|nr:tetratricopeptide repeat protein [Blastocatellia bacterium]
ATYIIIATAAVALIVYALQSRKTPPAPSGSIRTIAVLPFNTLAEERADEYLGVGMADALITRLGNIRQVVVRPTTTVLRYTGSDRDPQKAGRELEVEAILTGTIQRSGDKVRVTVQLAGVSDRSTLWSGRFDRDMTDIFTVQDSISQNVADALAVRLSGGEKELLAKRYSENNEAYQEYLKGRYYWNKRTADGIRKAMDSFDRAIALDSNFAMAYGGLADCYALLSWNGVMRPGQCMPKSKEMALRALELDETLAETHVSLARAHTYFDRDARAAEREYLRAIELNPNYPTAHHWYALYLMETGRTEEALREINRAHELDPVSLIINTAVGWLYYFARDYDHAISVLENTLELDPDFFRAHVWLALAYGQKGMFDKAIAHSERAIALSNRSSISVGALAYSYAISGRRAEARKLLEELLAIAKQKYVPPYFVAGVYTGLGDKDKAFEWLGKAHQERSTALLSVEPVFDPLRRDPRFRELLPSTWK